MFLWHVRFSNPNVEGRSICNIKFSLLSSEDISLNYIPYSFFFSDKTKNGLSENILLLFINSPKEQFNKG